ncbi:MAG TPA: hypothetical protein VF759_05785 [Allosphingosinicella sp.]
MRVDLFELLDGLFKGVVYFFYNVLESIYNVLRRPFRGPLRLQQAHRNPRLRQISAVTFLFVSFFIFFGFHLSTYELMDYDGGEPTLDQFLASVDEALRTTPTFSLDGDSLWPVLAATLAATVLFDSLLRLTLRAGLRGAPDRRHFVLAVMGYATFPAIALATIFARFAAFGWPLHVASFEAVGEWPWRFLPPIMIALIPAATLLASGLRLRRRIGRARNGPVAGAARVLAALILVTLFLVVAARTGAALGYRLVGERTMVGKDPLALETPVLMSQDCMVSGQGLWVEAVVWNKLTKPVAQRVKDYGADIGHDLEGFYSGANQNVPRVVELVLVGEDPPSQIALGAGEARVVRFVARDYATAAEDHGKECSLRVAGQAYDPSIQIPDVLE